MSSLWHQSNAAVVLFGELDKNDEGRLHDYGGRVQLLLQASQYNHVFLP